MVKDYSVQGTTKLQREKYAADALALSILGAPEPSDFAKKLMREYIDGKCELSSVRERIIEYYKAEAKNV